MKFAIESLHCDRQFTHRPTTLKNGKALTTIWEWWEVATRNPFPKSYLYFYENILHRPLYIPTDAHLSVTPFLSSPPTSSPADPSERKPTAQVKTSIRVRPARPVNIHEPAPASSPGETLPPHPHRDSFRRIEEGWSRLSAVAASCFRRVAANRAAKRPHPREEQRWPTALKLTSIYQCLEDNENNGVCKTSIVSVYAAKRGRE